ncbi:MAG TPA: pyruvate kinase [Candidatus Saccharimonadales bacterium]|jgi:pyruvate kinase
MKLTESAPSVPLQDYKRTKIVATLGPSCDSYEAVLEIIKSGANGLRLNFSHGTHDEHGQRIKWIRKASKELGKPVAIIQDLQGPKVRLGDFDGVINVKTGQALQFQYDTKAKGELPAGSIIPTQYDLAKKAKRGERLYLYDGKVRTTITSVKDGIVHVRAENDGILIKRKGMNLPDTDFGGDIITAKDKADLVYGSTQDIDYVAQSFVQTADDIHDLRKRMRNLGSAARIIAKIETKAAVDNLEEIMEATDAAMIARGDLAVETPPESVPIVQRKIIGYGLKHGKPTIVATQMLASMTETPEPTRAEVSDVATAVLLGADCVMLSDETASGKYPIEAVKVMKKVVRYTEANMPVKVTYPEYEDHSRQGSISKAIISLSDSIQARAIIAETRTGATAQQIATLRPNIPIIAVTSDVRSLQQMALIYNVKSYLRPVDANAAYKLTTWLGDHKVLSKGDIVVTVSGQHPGMAGATDTIKVRILE